jgi:hypothetical protein
MKGWVETRTAADGSRRYDACFWIGSKKKSKTFRTWKAADTYLTNMVQRVQAGTFVDVKPALMNEVFERYLMHAVDVRVKEGSLKSSTAKSYRSVIEEHLRPAFGAYRSDRFTLMAVEEWRKRIAEKIAAGDMSPRFYMNQRNLLHAIVDWARHPARRYLAHDPLAGLPRIRLPRAKKRPHFEPEQVASILTIAAKTPPDDTIIRTAALSGLRRGELLALMWSDLDASDGQDGGRLHVRRRIYQGTIDTPKTDHGDLPLTCPSGFWTISRPTRSCIRPSVKDSSSGRPQAARSTPTTGTIGGLSRSSRQRRSTVRERGSTHSATGTCHSSLTRTKTSTTSRARSVTARSGSRRTSTGMSSPRREPPPCAG